MGQLTDLHMWSRPLTPKEVEKYQDCGASFGSESSFINWSNSNITFNPNVIQIKNIPNDEVCHNEPKIKIFPHKMIFNNALKLCRDLDGKMFLPKNNDQQNLPSSCEGQFWIKADRLKNNSWVTISSSNDNSETSEIIDIGRVINSESPDLCLVASGSNFRIEHCYVEHCFICKIVRSPVFKFRGLHMDLFDTGYMLDLDEDLYNFRSFSGTMGIIGYIGE